MEKREIRFVSELRAEKGEKDAMVIGGYAALFNVESRDLGGFKEVILPGAFAQSLASGVDVRALFNHDPNQILGRTGSGTCTVKEDERGLAWRCVLDSNNTAHKNLYASIERRDISDCSFAFIVAKGGQSFEQRKAANGEPYVLRTLSAVNLQDVSAVTYPAYPGTSVDARSIFPDGVPAEVRSAVLNTRAADPDGDDDCSYEDHIQEVAAALNLKYPDGNGFGRFYTLETYDEYVIACECKTSKYFRFDYQETDAGFTFGEPQEVEQTWVPAERTAKRLEEFRSKYLAAMAQSHQDAANYHKDEAQMHNDAAASHQQAADAIAAEAAKQKAANVAAGFLEDDNVEENSYVDAGDVADYDEDDEGAERSVASMEKRGFETRDGKVLTKKVGGKAYRAKSFAYVGDPKDTSTWKLPIFDADHARNALARFDQTQGIPEEKKASVLRKIKAAAARFGIKVSDDDGKRSAAWLASAPLDEVEIRERRLRLSMVEL